MSSKSVVIALGYESKGFVECPECREQVEKFESPSGKVVYLNQEEHFAVPHGAHELWCGQAPPAETEQESGQAPDVFKKMKEVSEDGEDHTLPPVPDQSQYVR